MLHNLQATWKKPNLDHVLLGLHCEWILGCHPVDQGEKTLVLIFIWNLDRRQGRLRYDGDFSPIHPVSMHMVEAFQWWSQCQLLRTGHYFPADKRKRKQEEFCQFCTNKHLFASSILQHSSKSDSPHLVVSRGSESWYQYKPRPWKSSDH